MAEDAATTPVAEYRAAVKGLRDTAKWVLGTLGAIGAALVTGLGLSSLADLDEPLYLVLAILGIILALIGVAWGIAQTAAVLRPSTVSFDDIVTAEKDPNKRKAYLEDVFHAQKGMLGGSSSYEELQTKADDAFEKRIHDLERHYDAPTDSDKATKAAASQARAQLYGQRIDSAVARAAYGEVKSRLSIPQQLLAGALVAGGVCLFAVMLALPLDRPPDFRGADLSEVDLSGARLTQADFGGMRLSAVDFRDTDLRGTSFEKATLNDVNLLGANLKDANLKGTKWTGSTCPDGASSDESGNRCDHHLDRP